MADASRPLSNQEIINGTIGGVIVASASIFQNYLSYLNEAEHNQKKALNDFNFYNFTITPLVTTVGICLGVATPRFTYVLGGIVLVSMTITAIEKCGRSREKSRE